MTLSSDGSRYTFQYQQVRLIPGEGGSIHIWYCEFQYQQVRLIQSFRDTMERLRPSFNTSRCD